MSDAFGRPGTLERTVPHPMAEIPGSRLFEIRVGELTLHAWDLAEP